MIWTLGISKWRALAGKTVDDPTPPVNNENKIEIKFQLRPNQAYILNAGIVIEGKTNVPAPITQAATNNDKTNENK